MTPADTICRFCHKPIVIPLPDDKRMERLVRVLMTRACCNRCADYQRRQRDLGELLQHIVLPLCNGASQDERSRIQQQAQRICTAVVGAAEEHHLISGIQRDTPDFVANVLSQPRTALWQTREFVKSVVHTARAIHQQAA